VLIASSELEEGAVERGVLFECKVIYVCAYIYMIHA